MERVRNVLLAMSRLSLVISCALHACLEHSTSTTPVSLAQRTQAPPKRVQPFPHVLAFPDIPETMEVHAQVAKQENSNQPPDRLLAQRVDPVLITVERRRTFSTTVSIVQLIRNHQKRHT